MRFWKELQNHPVQDQNSNEKLAESNSIIFGLNNVGSRE
jgi:hypothetical protein